MGSLHVMDASGSGATSRVLVGEPFQVRALFMNAQDVPTSGRLIGSVERNGELISGLASIRVDVPAGESALLTARVAGVDEAGRYTIVAHVLHDLGATAEDEAALLVEDAGAAPRPSLVPMLLFGLFAAGAIGAAVVLAVRKLRA